jgi:hypothetical protein
MESKCPGCGHSVENWDQVQYCPFCGVHLEGSAGDDEDGRYSPWDDRANVGFLRALYDTWMKSVFHPTEFFSKMPVKGGYGSPMLYGFIIGEIAIFFSLFWQGIYMMMGTLVEDYGQFGEIGLSMTVLIFVALASPILVIIGYFVSAGILHLCLLLVGGARRDFEVTFRVVCYAAGANIFNVIPICGGLMAWLWNAVLNVIGIREAHEISSGKAFIAYCIPALVCCGFLAFVFMLALPEISQWFEAAMP